MSLAPDDFVIEEWCRDPFFVLKIALENACEFASAFISVSGIITSSDPRECKCNTKDEKQES